MRLDEGVFKPLSADVHMAGGFFNFFPFTAHIQEINRYAGAAIGTAVISFPSHYAKDAVPEMAKEVRLTLGGATIFRGVVGSGPYDVNISSDEMQLVAFDDKWLMEANTVGQIGIGSQGDPAGSDGFKDVGFEVVFNSDGKPNKDPSTREFNTGSTAVYWTLSDIIRFLFDYYVSESVATIDTGQISTSYDRVPSHLNLVGQSALQAIDTVVQLAGESWGLVPGASASAFIAVRPGYGRERSVCLIRPQQGGQATQVNTYYATECRMETNVKDARDVYQCVSGQICKDSTYRTDVDNPLLVRETTFKDKDYTVRYKVDVTAYAANNLGSDLSAGSKPKPWLSHLLTRMKADDSDYVTAAQIDATPALVHNDHVNKPFLWVQLLADAIGTGNPADDQTARLCVGGYRLITDAGCIDFKTAIELSTDAVGEKEEVIISDWSKVEVFLSVATVLELPQFVETDEDSKYLPSEFYQVINKPDLIPERRQNLVLPDLTSSNNNATTTIAEGDDEEVYVDIESKLEAAVEAAIEATPDIEAPLTATFPFVPDFNIGDNIKVKGRDIGATGNEVVRSISYKFTEGVPASVQVQASNITAGLDPEQFVEGA